MEMSELIKVTVYCKFEFHSFPFDNQECDLSLYDPINDATWILLSNIEHLCYKGMCQEFDENGWIFLPEQHGMPYSFKMKNIGTSNSSLGYSEIFYFYPWSITTVRFSLQRTSLDLLIGSFYLPTGLFGFLSIGSYIINPDIVKPLQTFSMFRDH